MSGVPPWLEKTGTDWAVDGKTGERERGGGGRKERGEGGERERDGEGGREKNENKKSSRKPGRAGQTNGRKGSRDHYASKQGFVAW